MRKYGCLVDVVPVEKNGVVNVGKIESALTKDTVMVSVMFVNNEIGTIQPIKEIGELCSKRGITFHVDAAQAIGKVPINVKEMKIGLLSISGHKVYGPKGIGALYISHQYSSKIEPIIFGGAQQNNLRAGTVPTFLCAGLGEACRIANEEMEEGFRAWIAATITQTPLVSRVIEHINEEGQMTEDTLSDLLIKIGVNVKEHKPRDVLKILERWFTYFLPTEYQTTQDSIKLIKAKRI